MHNLLIILGSPNDENGQLYPMAQGRLNKGIEIFKQQASSYKIVLTGGFGDHFNTTTLPHAHYAKAYLLSQGITADNLTDLALSCDTVDDALQCRPIINEHQPKHIIVVSSDFHIARVKFIFQTIFPNQAFDFYSSNYLKDCTPEMQKKLLTHEAQELESLQKHKRSKLMDVPLG